jgi:hypothetical protein
MLVALLGGSLVVAPVQAHDWRNQTEAVQPGVFVGAKFRLSMGGKTAAKPRAALAIAPSQSRVAGDGMVTTRIGEGIALNFGAGQKPALTLAGVRADRALGLTSGSSSPDGTRLGMSDGAKVAIGVGAALLVGAGVFLAVATSCADHEDECG